MMVTKARLSTPPTSHEDMEELLSECCQAKNRYTLVGGFSPVQRVFGTQTRILGCNLGDELQSEDISTMSAVESGDSVMVRSMQMRRAAQEAFSFVDSSARVRRAILSGPRAVRQFQPGDQVYFWRRDADVQAFRLEHVHAHWHGPAIVISHFKAKIWVSFRGHLWLCSPEHVRPCTSEEAAIQTDQVTNLLEASRNLSESAPGVHDPSYLSEPSTSARQVGPSDGPVVNRDGGSELVEQTRVPQTPAVAMSVPQTPVLRGRSITRTSRQNQDQEGRSRSRVRQEDGSLWNQSLFAKGEDEDEAMLQYLDCYSGFFAVDFNSSDRIEHVVLMTASQNAKKRKEILYHRLSAADQGRFSEAMLREFRNNILRPDAGELLSVSESQEIRSCPLRSKRILPTRWVLVEKDMGLGQESMAKARMVVQGYQDPDLGELEISSPTLHKDSFLMILQMIVSFRWDFVLADIKGAFMSSRPLQREQGELYAALPKLWLHHQEAHPNQLLRMKVAWYGLNDGPREFFTTLDEELRKLGCSRCPLDPCVYIWHYNGRPAGVIGVTVDNLCCGGSEAFREEVLGQLKSRFTFGKVCEKEGRLLVGILSRCQTRALWLTKLTTSSPWKPWTYLGPEERKKTRR